MKKVIFSCLLAFCLIGVSCIIKPAVATPVSPDENKPYIMPGAPIRIDKFRPGAVADAEDEAGMRITIHLGRNTFTKLWSVTTEANETTVTLPPLSTPVWGGQGNIISVTTSTPEVETPAIKSFNSITQEVTVINLKPSSTRILGIIYLAQAIARIRLILEPYDGQLGYWPAAPVEVTSWITIDGQPVDNIAYIMSPYETRTLYVKLEMPPAAWTPKKWCFKIGYTPTTTGNVIYEGAATFIVTMR